MPAVTQNLSGSDSPRSPESLAKGQSTEAAFAFPLYPKKKTEANPKLCVLNLHSKLLTYPQAACVWKPTSPGRLEVPHNTATLPSTTDRQDVSQEVSGLTRNPKPRTLSYVGKKIRIQRMRIHPWLKTGSQTMKSNKKMAFEIKCPT